MNQDAGTGAWRVVGADADTRARRQGTALMTGAGVLLGTMGVFVIEAGEAPLTTVAFRCAFGLFALHVWGASTGRLGELRVRGLALAGAIVSGLLMAASWALHFAAIPRISIGLSTLVFHLQPFWLMGLGAWLHGDALSGRQVRAAFAAFLGLVLSTGIVAGGSDALSLTHEQWAGVLMSAVGSLCYAAVTLLARQLRSLSSFTLVWWQCLVGALLTAWWPIVNGWPVHAAAWGWLIGLGALHTGLAYAMLFAGAARLGTARVALLQFVYPLAAILVDWAVYGHALSSLQLAGVAIMAGALWAARPAS